MKKLLSVLLLVLGVALVAAPADAASGARAYKCLVGGADSGCLDETKVADLEDGEWAIVIFGDAFSAYQFHASATDAQESPKFIRPYDYANSGVWYRVKLEGDALDSGRASEPAVNFYDRDATDSDINAKIYAQCTATASGAEDCDLYLQVQVSGVLTTRVKVDADDKLIDFQDTKVVTTGVMAGKVPTVVNSDTTPYNITQAQARAGTLFLSTNSATTTYVLPAAEAGMAVCIRQGHGVAQALRVDTDGTDFIVKSDGARTTAAGDYYGATASAKNKICLAAYDATDWYVESEVGTWTEE